MHYLIRLKTLLQYNYFYIVLVILVLCLAFIRNSFYNQSKFNGSETSFVGVVDEIKKSDDYYKITIKSKEKIIGSYYSKDSLNISLGDKITFKGTLSKPKNNKLESNINDILLILPINFIFPSFVILPKSPVFTHTFPSLSIVNSSFVASGLL